MADGKSKIIALILWGSLIFQIPLSTVSGQIGFTLLLGFAAIATLFFYKHNPYFALFFAACIPSIANPGFIKIALALIMIITCSQSLKSKHIQIVMFCLLVSNLILGSLQFQDLDPIYSFRQGFQFSGFAENKNSLSGLMAIGMPAFFTGNFKYFFWVPILGLIFCASYGGVFAIIAALIVYGIMFDIWWVWLFIIVGTLYLMVDTPEFSHRYSIWSDTIKNLSFAGHGLGSFKIDSFYNHWGDGGYYAKCHNDFLQCFYELGVFGFLAPVGYCWRIFRKRAQVSCQALIGIMTAAFNALVSSPIHYGASAVVTMLWIAQAEREINGNN